MATNPSPALRICYYHQDHLGSANVITDAGGALVQETAFYPFGVPRNDYRLRETEEPYQFSQKERDSETGWHDFGARLCLSHLGRFDRPDPIQPASQSRSLREPQRLNVYSYCVNRPIIHADPDGAEPIIVVGSGAPGLHYMYSYKDAKSKAHTVQVNLLTLKNFDQIMRDVAGRYARDLKDDTRVVVVKTPEEAATALASSGQGGSKVLIGHTIYEDKATAKGTTRRAIGFEPIEHSQKYLPGEDIGKIVRDLGGDPIVVGCYGGTMATSANGKGHARGPQNWADFKPSAPNVEDLPMDLREKANAGKLTAADLSGVITLSVSDVAK